MTELSWLLDLLLNQKLSPTCKQLVSERIKYVEQSLSQKPWVAMSVPYTDTTLTVPRGTEQSPSTLALMAKHQAQGLPPISEIANTDAVAVAMAPNLPQAVPVTAATQMALQHRQQTIQRALSTNKPEPGMTGPRKF